MLGKQMEKKYDIPEWHWEKGRIKGSLKQIGTVGIKRASHSKWLHPNRVYVSDENETCYTCKQTIYAMDGFTVKWWKGCACLKCRDGKPIRKVCMFLGCKHKIGWNEVFCMEHNHIWQTFANNFNSIIDYADTEVERRRFSQVLTHFRKGYFGKTLATVKKSSQNKYCSVVNCRNNPILALQKGRLCNEHMDQWSKFAIGTGKIPSQSSVGMKEQRKYWVKTFNEWCAGVDQ